VLSVAAPHIVFCTGNGGDSCGYTAHNAAEVSVLSTEMTEGRMQSKTGMGGDQSAVYCGRSFERARGLLQEMSRKKLKSASSACQAHYEGLKI